MRTSQNGIALIKRFEGLILKAKDHGDSNTDKPLFTIGYGHTRTAHAGMVITETQAFQLLLQDIRIAEDDVLALVEVPLNQNQFDALVSFVFNIGFAQFSRSTLLEVINKGDVSKACIQFQRWTYDNGNQLNGLVSRRAAECELFSKPIDDVEPVRAGAINPAPIRREREKLSQSRTMKAGGGAATTAALSYAANKFESIVEALPHYADDVLFFMMLGFILFIMWCRFGDWKKAQS